MIWNIKNYHGNLRKSFANANTMRWNKILTREIVYIPMIHLIKISWFQGIRA